MKGRPSKSRGKSRSPLTAGGKAQQAAKKQVLVALKGRDRPAIRAGLRTPAHATRSIRSKSISPKDRKRTAGKAASGPKKHCSPSASLKAKRPVTSAAANPGLHQTELSTLDANPEPRDTTSDPAAPVNPISEALPGPADAGQEEPPKTLHIEIPGSPSSTLRSSRVANKQLEILPRTQPPPEPTYRIPALKLPMPGPHKWSVRFPHLSIQISWLARAKQPPPPLPQMESFNS